MKNNRNYKEHPLSRQEIQNQATAIESLIDSAMSFQGDYSTDDSDSLMILGMPRERIAALGLAMDSINTPEITL